MSTDAYIELVYRNLKGDLSPEEFRSLNEMTAKDDALARLRIEIEEAWDLAGELPTVTTEKETRLLQDRIRKSHSKSASIFSLRNVITGIAAVFVLGLSAIWLLRDQTEVYTEEGLIRLADNSMVELREGSRLEVVDMSEKVRKVHLRGEAYFDVSPNSERPFTVESKDARIEVLGTKFLVKESSTSVYVVLDEGRVKLSGESDSLVMSAGMKAQYRSEEGITTVDYQNLTGWQSATYQYVDQPLSVVVDELSLIFNNEIRVENQSLLNCLINAILTAENLNENLNQLAAQLEMNAEYDGKVWILSEGTCR